MTGFIPADSNTWQLPPCNRTGTYLDILYLQQTSFYEDFFVLCIIFFASTVFWKCTARLHKRNISIDIKRGNIKISLVALYLELNQQQKDILQHWSQYWNQKTSLNRFKLALNSIYMVSLLSLSIDSVESSHSYSIWGFVYDSAVSTEMKSIA